MKLLKSRDKGRNSMNLGLHFKKAILIVLAGLLPFVFQSPTQAQESRQCYVNGGIDQLSTDSYRLYYLAFEDNGYELWYVDQARQHNTGYRINQPGISARLSPDEQKLLIVYVEDGTAHIEMVDLHGLSVERWTIPTETGIHQSSTSVVWIDNQHIGFESLFQRQLVIQNIDSQNYQTIPYPEFDSFDSDVDFLMFSPNFEYVLHPVSQDNLHDSRTYIMTELSTSSTILEFDGFNPVWSTNSQHVNFMTDDELGVASVDGEVLTTKIQASGFEFVQGLSNATGYAALSAFHDPRPALLTNSLWVMDMESGQATDICSYGDIVYTTIGGRFNNQLVLWSAEESLFAYLIRVPRGYRIVVANITEENSVVIIPQTMTMDRGIPILVGWVST